MLYFKQTIPYSSITIFKNIRRNMLTDLYSVLLLYYFVIISSFCYAATQTRLNQLSYDCINFSGGGIYFWWQAGATKYLAENHLVSSDAKIVGSSAGSLTATLLKCNCDFDYSAEFAIFQARRDKLWDSRLGLLGIWGSIVEEWLVELVPNNVTSEQLKNLYITATPINVFRGQEVLSNFKSKSDVISACLVSCHIPFFMNGKLYRKHNNRRYIDGSFWSTYPMSKVSIKGDISKLVKYNRKLDINWKNDLDYSRRSKGKSFVSLLTPEGLYDLMQSGYSYMKRQHLNGLIY